MDSSVLGQPDNDGNHQQQAECGKERNDSCKQIIQNTTTINRSLQAPFIGTTYMALEC